MVNLWSTDHNFYQNACVCHRDEICYLNVLSSSRLFIYQTKSGGFWTPQGSHNSLNLGHTHLSRLPCWDFNPMAGRLLLNGGQKLGWGGCWVGPYEVAAAAQVAAPPQSRPVATGQPEPSGDLPPKRASSGLTISHAGLGLTKWDGFHLSVIFLGVCEFSQNL